MVNSAQSGYHYRLTKNLFFTIDCKLILQLDKTESFSGSPPSKHFYFILKSQFELVLILFLTCNSSVFNC